MSRTLSVASGVQAGQVSCEHAAPAAGAAQLQAEGAVGSSVAASAAVQAEQAVGCSVPPTPSPRLAAALARLLAKHPPQKKPRLELGEVVDWDGEYRQLVQWIRENEPRTRAATLQTALANPCIKYTDDQMDALESFLRRFLVHVPFSSPPQPPRVS